MEQDRQASIRQKGFDMTGKTDYGRIKVGMKTLEDAVLNLSSIKDNKRNFHNKGLIMKALAEKDLVLLRAISDYFYRTNGIYSNVCNYYANLYRYD